MEKLKIALLQLKVGFDKEENLLKAEDFIVTAAGNGADVAVLPEMFFVPFDPEFIRTTSEPLNGETIALLKEVAQNNRIAIMAGSFPEQADDGKCYNTAVYIGRDGEIRNVYRKNHLFDVTLEDFSFRESSIILSGDSAEVFETEFGTAGLAVCYDLRFPELFQKYAAAGARVIFVPAVFNSTTGPAHWELLVRARALDNQLFVVACAPAVDKSLPFQPYGNSMVVGPWGDIISRADGKETILYAEIDFSVLDQVRKRIPLAEHRRPELY